MLSSMVSRNVSIVSRKRQNSGSRISWERRQASEVIAFGSRFLSPLMRAAPPAADLAPASSAVARSHGQVVYSRSVPSVFFP